jgi:hypothetical protein
MKVHRCGACRAWATGFEECGVEIEGGNLLGGLPSKSVISESADNVRGMAKLPRMNCKVQGSASQSSGVRKQIPKNLADGNDAIRDNVM